MATSNTINYKTILNHALRAQSAYILTQMGWALSEHLGWQMPHGNQITIQEVVTSEVNVILEMDHQNKVQWISVRGSSNLRNWLLNLQYTQRYCDMNDPNMPCGGVDLHKGFRVAATEVFHSILPRLRQDYTTRLTGHSLGGAIAAILMLFLAEIDYKIERCITFGQPKVTDRAGAEKMATMPLIRVIHDDDIVPHLPPTTPLTFLQGGYQHFGTEIVLHDSSYSPTMISQAGVLSQEAKTGFWSAVGRSLLRTNIRDLSGHIADHELRKYVHSIINVLAAHSQATDAETSVLRILSLLPMVPERSLVAA